MIDIEFKEYLKLKPNDKVAAEVQELLVPSEDVIGAFSGSNGNVVFTTGRVIIIGDTGKRGKRTEYTTVLYKNLTSFAIDTSGRFDKDAGLNITATNVGSIHFEFRGKPDIVRIYQHITYTTMK